MVPVAGPRGSTAAGVRGWPTRGGRGPASGKTEGFRVEEGQQVRGVSPQFVVGMKAMQGLGEAPPNELEDGEFGGELSVGGEEGGCDVEGGSQAALPSMQEVQGH